MLDDGRVTDSQGRVVSFRNSIVILTSNIGSTFILEEETPGAARERVMASVRAHAHTRCTFWVLAPSHALLHVP
jgi:ATP-dependent Clp protease ATP-binding subunit ClpB